MHDWASFAATTTTLVLPSNMTPHDATSALYTLPRGVSFEHKHVFHSLPHVGDNYMATLVLDRNQFDVVTNFHLVQSHGDAPVYLTLITENKGHHVETDVTPALVLLLVSSVFTRFVLKVHSTEPVSTATLVFTASLYDAFTRQKLAMQPWQTATHQYQLGTALNR